MKLYRVVPSILDETIHRHTRLGIIKYWQANKLYRRGGVRVTATVNSFSVFLYTTIMHFFGKIANAHNNVVNSNSIQKNAGFWVVAYIVVAIVGLALLSWVCSKFGGGASYGGKFKLGVLSLEVFCK